MYRLYAGFEWLFLIFVVNYDLYINQMLLSNNAYHVFENEIIMGKINFDPILIEIIVVIVILTVLMAVVVPVVMFY